MTTISILDGGNDTKFLASSGTGTEIDPFIPVHDINADSVLTTKSGFGELVTDAWGAPKVSFPKSVFHGMWTFDIPQSQWFMYENGTQVYTSTQIASVDGAASLTTSVVNSTIQMESRECPRYQPNRGHLFSTALWCPNKTNDGIREWGLSTVENGVFFRLKADGLLYAVLRSGGVETHEEVIDTSSIAGFDIEKGNVYDIQFQWRGVGNYKFYVNLTLVHTFGLLGTLTALSMENPALPVNYKATRTTADVNMVIGCADITSENGETDKEQYTSAYIVGAAMDTNTPVIVIHNPLLITGKTNTRTVTLARIAVSNTKKGSYRVWVTRDPSSIVGATLKPIGSGSFVQTDSTDIDNTAVRATSVNTALMKPVTSIFVESNIRVSVDNPYRGRIEFPIVRGDYLVVTYDGTAGTGECVVEIGEQI